jgi:RNA polymerase sigma-70 factor (ECF subfamily)
VPLAQQDARLWSRDMIIEAEGLLHQAARSATFGRFQCEAAIQSVHAQRPITGRVQHEALATLYGLLVARHPSVGARVGQAAALLEAGHPLRALEGLQSIDESEVRNYQPYWATRLHVHRALGQADAAVSALQVALSLTPDEAVRRFLLGLHQSSHATPQGD